MNRAFAAQNINATYTASRVTRHGLPESMKSLAEARAGGANVTYPLKADVLRHVDERTKAVEIIGAANTLCFQDDRIEAHNTDVTGVVTALGTLAGTSTDQRSVLIVGAGGAGRAAAYGVLEAGAEAVMFAVRDLLKAGAVVERLRRAFPTRRIDVCELSALGGLGQELLGSNDIIINATPVGMSGFRAQPLFSEEAAIDSRHCCFDFVYHPVDTEFLRLARQRGAKTLDGLALLVAQAQGTFSIWTGSEFALTDMYEALTTHRAAAETIAKKRGFL